MKKLLLALALSCAFVTAAVAAPHWMIKAHVIFNNGTEDDLTYMSYGKENQYESQAACAEVLMKDENFKAALANLSDQVKLYGGGSITVDCVEADEKAHD